MPYSGASDTLAILKFIACLGNDTASALTLSDSKVIDGKVNLSNENGEFKLLGICKEGGTRLINPSGKAGIHAINPNPAIDELKISVKNIEDGETNLIIYNSMGTEVNRIKVDNLSGIQYINVNLSDYSSGIYFVKYQSPTWFEYKKIVVRK